MKGFIPMGLALLSCLLICSQKVLADDSQESDVDDASLIPYAMQLGQALQTMTDPTTVASAYSPLLQLMLGNGSPEGCLQCRVVVEFVKLQMLAGLNATGGNSDLVKASMISMATGACVALGIASSDVCSGSVLRMGPVLYHMLYNDPSIPTSAFCGLVFEPYGCTAPESWTNWDVNVAPKVCKSKNEPLFKHSDFKGDTIKVLHLTDIHLDMEYAVGSNSYCGDPLCCRSSSVGKMDGSIYENSTAGTYGAYFQNCDLPYGSLVNALQYINQTFTDIDMIYLTGDYAPHNTWSSDTDEVAAMAQIVTNLVKESFPTVKQVVPLFGNHDMYPANEFSPPDAPPELSSFPIYYNFSQMWEGWLTPDAVKSMAEGGSYTLQITKEHLLININSNVCYVYNFWLMATPVDLGGHLHWLARELAKARKRGSYVHILGHISPATSDCFSPWARNYYRIVNEYQDIIQAQFFGHTHWDEFQVTYSQDEPITPISSVFIGPSLTPWTELNAGFSINYVNKVTFEVMEHETYVYNLTAANANPTAPPAWYKLYSATEEYGIPDLTPSSLDQFVKDMAANNTLLNQYYNNFDKGGELDAGTCDSGSVCQYNLLCGFVRPFTSATRDCDIIEDIIDAAASPA